MANGTALAEPNLKGGRFVGGDDTAQQVVPERVERIISPEEWGKQVDPSWLRYNTKALEKIAAAKIAEQKNGLEKHHLAALRRGRYAYGVWPRKSDQERSEPVAVIGTPFGGTGTGVFRSEAEMQSHIQPAVTVEAIIVDRKRVEPEEITGAAVPSKNIVFTFSIYGEWVPNVERAVAYVREMFAKPKDEFWRMATRAGAGKLMVKPLEEYE